MLDLKFLKNSGFFRIIELKNKEVLFDEGSIDNNLYIIKSGKINIEKYTTNEKKEKKVLAQLGRGDFFGEGSLNSEEPKEVGVVSVGISILLKIDAKNKISEFIKKYPKQGLELLKNIIKVGNKRLLESNSLITSTYEMNKTISGIREVNNKTLFRLIVKIEKILGVNYIIYLEKNPVMKDYATIKYDTREPNKMKDETIELQESQVNLKVLENIGKYSLVENLNIADKILGYLVIGKNNEDFSENEVKIIKSISNSLSGVIEQKEFFEEEKNKQFSEIR